MLPCRPILLLASLSASMIRRRVALRYLLPCLTASALAAPAAAQTPPAVSSVALVSTPAAGQNNTYKPGDTVRARVTFDAAVDVVNSPVLKLRFDPSFGEKDMTFDTSGTTTNTTTLEFTYTVASGHVSWAGASGDLSTAGIAFYANKLSLPAGASIRATGTATDANLDFAQVDHDAAHKVDGVPPTLVATQPILDGLTPATAPTEPIKVTSSAGPDNTYAIGDHIEVTAIFTENVTVRTVGTPVVLPRIEVCCHLFPGYAVYHSGGGNTSPVFRYTVREGDEEPDGISIPWATLELEGASFQDALGNETRGTVLDPPTGRILRYLLNPLVPPNPSHKVDGVRPRVSGGEVNGETLTLTWSEALDTNSAPAGSAFSVSATPSDSAARTIPGTGTASTSGTTVRVTLASAVTPGEAVTVSYARPASNPIQDTPGNDATGFSGRPADNNTPVTPPPVTPPPPANSAPVADAGEEVEADPGAVVRLDGSGSSDPDGDTLRYTWRQTSGEAVTLTGADTAAPSFTAPTAPATLTFRLTVSDPGGLSASDEVTMRVGARTSHVALLESAANPVRDSFVRVINRSAQEGEVSIVAIDDAGAEYGPLTLRIGANAAVHFSSPDLEEGNVERGLSDGVGEGEGDWRLELTSTLDLEVLSYVRTFGGALASLHDVVPENEAGHRVVFFNPASNRSRVSWLRLINPGEEAAAVRISGVDDAGEAGESVVALTLAAGASRSLSAQVLESGEGEELSGALGDGAGKWRLRVSADHPIRVMSLLRSTDGSLTNVSTAPAPEGAVHRVPLLPPASHPHRDGMVRVINRSAEAGAVSIVAFDDAGTEYAPLTLHIGANATVHFSSADLEAGNPDKGLASGTGAAEGAWRLELTSPLDLEVLSYVRTAGGALASLHDVAPEDEAGHRVVFFNPASNRSRVNWLRLINPGEEAVPVRITGVDSAGDAGESAVELTLAAGASRSLSVRALESGEGERLTGALGDGASKWRLRVSADHPIRVMSLLRSTEGSLTNVSTVPAPASTTFTSPAPRPGS